MILEKEKYFVVTGGPGSGKTSIISELRKRDVYCIPESGRGIIQEQISVNGTGLPWVNPVRFRELMLLRDLQNYRLHQNRDEIVVFDRGIVDVLGYSRLTQLGKDLHIERAVEQHRYNQQAFIAPPWRAIYVNDRERKQTFQEAVATHDAMVRAYNDSGYTLTELNYVSPAERAEQILENLAARTKHC